MANSYFQFKQFIIHQDRCAMKVTTDGCLFGAIVAQDISESGAGKMLDIGAGTGLLSLMIAQENDSLKIDAVEIDKAAAIQAKDNVATSLWKDRIQVLQNDILAYQPAELYDVIISNPPFYERQLTSPKVGRQLAHHSSELTLLQLFQQVKAMLQSAGKFYVLLPFYRKEEAIEIAKSIGLFSKKEWLIKQTTKHDFFRVIICFSDREVNTKNSFELAIRNEKNEYTNEFTELLRPYYLQI